MVKKVCNDVQRQNILKKVSKKVLQHCKTIGILRGVKDQIQNDLVARKELEWRDC
jgi:hypothetical protein